MIVDLALVTQFFYYPHEDPVVPHRHTRVTTATSRRMSIDRAPSRYRTLSTAAANVAVTAALAAEYDEHPERRRLLANAPRKSAENGRTSIDRLFDNPYQVHNDDEAEESALATMADSFHSEGGRDIGRTRFSWNTEHHGRRGVSVGPDLSTGQTLRTVAASIIPEGRGRSLSRGTEEHSQATNRRSSRAGRQGAGMLFLSVFALFSIGAMVNNGRSVSTQRTGRVLSLRTAAVSTIDGPVLSGIEHIAIHNPHSSNLEQYIVLEGPITDPAPLPSPPTEQILGRIFAWLCTTLYLTSRLPQIWKNVGAHLIFRLHSISTIIHLFFYLVCS